MNFNSRFVAYVTLVLLSGTVLAKERAPIVVTPEAAKLHASCLMIDGHNDLPWEIRSQGSSDFTKLDISNPQPTLQTDLPRLIKGGVDAQFWSVWVPADTAYRGTALASTLEQIELVKLMINRYPEQLELALTVDDIERISAQGKIASLIGVEGGHCIEESLGVLRQLYSLGARYMTLTHSDTIPWADSGTDEEKHGGLTPFGIEVVHEMNRLGMMVDLSHVSIPVMEQAIEASSAPVVFSHSSAVAIANHPRNVPDSILAKLPEKDGIVMVNFFSGFVVPKGAENYSIIFKMRRDLKAKGLTDLEVKGKTSLWSKQNPMPNGTIHDLLDHIDHIAKLAGARHIGIGSDFDGVSVLPEQLEDVACYPRITQGLLDRNYTEDDIRGILGGNLLRVMRRVEEVAAELAAKE